MLPTEVRLQPAATQQKMSLWVRPPSAGNPLQVVARGRREVLVYERMVPGKVYKLVGENSESPGLRMGQEVGEPWAGSHRGAFPDEAGTRHQKCPEMKALVRSKADTR